MGLGIRICVGLGGLCVVAACSTIPPEGTPIEGQSLDASTGVEGQGSPSACVPKNGGAASLPKTDPATLPKCACEGGSARCVPKDVVPANVSAQLTTCKEGYDGLCVPDALVKSGGAAPPACKSLGGAAGVCLSVCVPQVAEFKDLLPGDGCAADERCAPCLNPLEGNKPTGACDIGKAATGPECEDDGSSPTTPGDGGTSTAACPYVGPPIVDPATFPSCGDHAHCVPNTVVPANLSSLLKACPTGLCAPDEFIAAAGNYVPKTCDSIGGAEGRCTNKVIPQVEAQAALLPQGSCQAWEKCAPCTNPLDGKVTGACTIACDPGPKKPGAAFKACCSDRGRCVPTTAVPPNLAKNLGTDDGTCVEGTELCAPTENIDPAFKPNACSAVSLGTVLGGVLTGNNVRYTGVCLSNCLVFAGIEKLGVAKGNCDDLHVCAPCVNPLTGAPTGAPGCPAAP